MENVSTRTLTMNPAGEWLAAAGAFMGRVRLAIRAFGEALRKEPVRSRPKARRRSKPLPSEPQPAPWKEPGELPETYGRTKVVAMVVSPYLVHVYWDLSAKDQAQSGAACLRFHDATAGGSFDVNVDLGARNWYVHLWSPEKRYSVELGLQRADVFQPLARSNPIETPRAWPVSDVAQVSEPPKPAPPAAAEQAEQPITGAPAPPAQPAAEQPITAAPAPPAQPASVPPASVSPPDPSAPQSVTPEGAAPASPRPVPPVPANAFETLRRRLSELYGFYRSPRPAPAAPESAAAEEPVPLPPETAGPETRDFTDRLEAKFSPGLSSAQLPDRKPPG
jgi:uncharacterized protein DUF4912